MHYPEPFIRTSPDAAAGGTLEEVGDATLAVRGEALPSRHPLRPGWDRSPVRSQPGLTPLARGRQSYPPRLPAAVASGADGRQARLRDVAFVAAAFFGAAALVAVRVVRVVA